MALTGLSSVNGTTSAIEDKGLRDFISTASGSWTGGGGGSSPVTSTGGTSTYINKLNNMNLSASVAYASPNGALLDNVYNSGRSGYAASAYLNSDVTGNVSNWNAARNYVTANSGSLLYEVASYDSYNNPNFWYSTANNVYGFKINSGNFSQLTVSNARMNAWRIAGGRTMLDLYFWFSKFVPTATAATYVTTQSNFFSFSKAHIAAPVFSRVESIWNNTFGCIQANTTWGTDIALNVWAPWTGYTGQDMVVTAHINIGL